MTEVCRLVEPIVTIESAVAQSLISKWVGGKIAGGIDDALRNRRLRQDRPTADDWGSGWQGNVSVSAGASGLDGWDLTWNWPGPSRSARPGTPTGRSPVRP
ncbi:hypothetical protein GCM10027447_26060 [Glycomyces halotolerans]